MRKSNGNFSEIPTTFIAHSECAHCADVRVFLSGQLRADNRFLAALDINPDVKDPNGKFSVPK